MTDSGSRTIRPGARTPSAEMVMIPKRILVEVYGLILEQDEAIQKLSETRVDIHATKRKLEELLNQYVPGLVIEVMLHRRDTEPTPLETPASKDIEDSKRSK
jgi:hypothetical protein